MRNCVVISISIEYNYTENVCALSIIVKESTTTENGEK